ncbi:Hook-filament junction protein [Serratia plymuthica]|uniref:Hook-filament junction protein n=1 Tax=Serratia plymuthica TaxID=82996 RepID=A0A2X4VB62_SERPL|nr:Hook-filament junction protein [Serratia plymuthica]
MRMSTSMMYQQNMTGITGNQSLFMKAAEQLSTGKKSQQPVRRSAGGVAGGDACPVPVGKHPICAGAHLCPPERVDGRDGAGRATSTISDMKALIVNAGGTKSDNDRDSLATQLQGLKDQLLNQANSTDGNGRFMFGGFENDKPPFANNGGSVSYVGGNTPVEQKVDANRIMTVGHTGDTVFMSLTSNPKPEPDGSASVSNVFESIDIALKALKTPLDGRTTPPNSK